MSGLEIKNTGTGGRDGVIRNADGMPEAPTLSEQEVEARKQRNRLMLIVLIGMVALFYGITIYKMTPGANGGEGVSIPTASATLPR